MKKKYKIHKEGYKILITLGIVFIGINLLLEIFMPSHNLLQIIGGVVSFMMFFLVAALS